MPICPTCKHERAQALFITRLEKRVKTCEPCRVKNRAKFSTYYKANKKVVTARIARWRARNPDGLRRARKIVNKRYRKNNPQYAARQNKRWREKYPHKNAAKSRAYEASKLRAKPGWADLRAIEMFYELARLQRVLTGESVHVEHIVPLNSKLVCGLHCEDNLRLTGGVYNSRKSNKTWPGMP